MSAAENRMPATALEWALYYASLGWSVVPVRAGEKMPAEGWYRFQTMPATPAEIRGWFDANPRMGVGLVQGRTAGSIVLDFDGELGMETLRRLEAQGLPNSARVFTPGGGVHVYLRHPGVPIATRKSVLPGMDVRGDGGFVVAPPSLHATGRPYCWDVDAHPEDVPLADCPAWLLPTLQAPVEGPSHLTEVTRAAGPLGLQGAVSDGREAYMRDTVLAVVSDLYQRLGHMPSPEQVTEAGWDQYARNVDFSRPGRGRAEWDAKVRYTLARAEKGAIRGFETQAAAAEGVEASPQGEGAGQQDTKTPRPLWTDVGMWEPGAVPARPWVVPSYLMRGSVSVLSGQGAGGKSSLVVAWTLALASGEALGAFEPKGPMIVVNYNVEDDRDEQHRRYGAALKAQGKDGRAVMPSIVRCGPYDVGTLFERGPDGRITQTSAMDMLEQVCMESSCDVLVCDPLAELHNAEENDNTAMRAVVAAFRSLAKRLGIAVLVLHHDRKGANAPGDMDRMRGASAISGAVRVALTLSTMSNEEADKFGVPPDHRRRHFRIDGAKSNYAVAAEAEWWRLSAYPIGNGEEVAACLPWVPPSAFGDLTLKQCVAVLARLRAGTTAGHAFGATKQAGDEWAGRLLEEEPYKRTETQAAAILSAWEAEKVLTKSKQEGPRRGHPRFAYTVDETKFQEMRRSSEVGSNGA